MPGLAPESAQALVQNRATAAPEWREGALVRIEPEELRAEDVDLQQLPEGVDHVDGHEAAGGRKKHAVEIEAQRRADVECEMWWGSWHGIADEIGVCKHGAFDDVEEKVVDGEANDVV